MINWLKNILIKGEVKIKFIAYDDSVPDDEIQPYEDVATLPYEGEYDEFVMKTKLRKFVRLTSNHLIIEMTVIERTENGKDIKISD
jgi:hypothetical protein